MCWYRSRGRRLVPAVVGLLLATTGSLLGTDRQIDSGNKQVTASLMARGKETGVKLQLRAGGPATGYVDAIPLMYSDPSTTIGAPSYFDEVIQWSKTQPTLAVMNL